MNFHFIRNFIVTITKHILFNLNKEKQLIKQEILFNSYFLLCKTLSQKIERK